MDRRSFLSSSALAFAVAPLTGASAQTIDIPPHIRDLIIRSFCFQRPKLRSNIYTLAASGANHPTIDAYRRAIRVMRTLPASDPHSLEFQADIHGTDKPSATWPSNAPFATCQHGFHFLAWHRMYIYFFERIVRSISGYGDFALPYWDYGQSGQRALPAVFRDTTAGTDPNPLFDNTRNGTINGGGNLPASAVDAQPALDETGFSVFQSILNGTPHGNVHVVVSGNMGAFETAGRDPIFWLHHCNIDRLWEKWLSLGGRANPIGDSGWMNTEYFFYDECRRLVKLTGAEILYTVTQLDYQYQDPRTCIPLIVAALNPALFEIRKLPKPLRFLLARELVLNNKRLLVAPEKPDERQIEFFKSLDAGAIGELRKQGQSINLVFEGLHVHKPIAGYYEVYVNLPEGEKPDPDGPFYAGSINFFGRDMAGAENHKGKEHLPVVLNATGTLARLAERRLLNNGRIDLSFVLVTAESEAGKEAVLDTEAEPGIESIFIEVEQPAAK